MGLSGTDSLIFDIAAADAKRVVAVEIEECLIPVIYKHARENGDGFGLIEQVAGDGFLPRGHDLIEYAGGFGRLLRRGACLLCASFAILLCKGICRSGQKHRKANRKEKRWFFRSIHISPSHFLSPTNFKKLLTRQISLAVSKPAQRV